MNNPERKTPDGFSEAIAVFREAASAVPAYALFLKEKGIHPDMIRSYDDFLTVPLMDKATYLRAYPFFDLFPGRKIPPAVSASSGSSGKPFYWPRGDDQEEAGGKMHERIFRDIYHIAKDEPTLVIVCFSMGTWIAGAYTFASMRWMSRAGWTISTITPSIEKEDAVAILRDLAPLFRRIVLAGYPPLLRDVLEEAAAQNVNISALRPNLLFAGESFSEKWRDSMHALVGISDAYFGSASIYGTADAGAVGHETPITTYLRREISKRPSLAERFNVESVVPTIVQYDPRKIFFEKVGGEFVFTTQAGIPLVRYAIHDTGELVSHDEMRSLLSEEGLVSKAEKLGFNEWNLPFIFLGSRSDVSTTFYALNIYPENIKAGLEASEVQPHVSGKFLIYTKTGNRGRDQKLYVDVECARDVAASPALARKLAKSIFGNLLKLNAEYRKLYRSIGKRALPHILLSPFGDPRFVVKKSKHRWSER